MKIDDTNFTDKGSLDPVARRLFEEVDDYITAYSKYTDLRVERDGPAQAIGGDWEEHGPLQLKFLIERGLKPSSRLLDFGCGTGRFSRHAVPFLNPKSYTGIDISPKALRYAAELADREGWAERLPRFILSDGSLSEVKGKWFDFIWLHSVFTHLPPELISQVISDLQTINFDEFLFTFKRKDHAMRTGLKQFGYPFEFFSSIAEAHGFKAVDLNRTWPQGQSCGVIYRE